VNLYLASAVVAAAALLVWCVPKWQTSTIHVQGKDRLALENELRKTIAQIVGGAAILAGLYFTWQQLQASRASLEIAQEAQTTERFTRAVDQIGNQQLQVRVGGIYALGEISQDPAHDRHRVVMSVLTAFLRDKASWRLASPRASAPEDIQAALSVIAARGPKWTKLDTEPGHEIDLSGTDLRRVLAYGGNLEETQLSRAHFEGADLRKASLRGAALVGAHLEETLLDGADLSGADLRGAELRGASVSGADLRGTRLEGVDLTSVIGLSPAQLQAIVKDKETLVPDVSDSKRNKLKRN
jgi:Pentapeptide repeats (8 copies)